MCLKFFFYYYFDDNLKGYIMNCLNGEGIYIAFEAFVPAVFLQATSGRVVPHYSQSRSEKATGDNLTIVPVIDT